jgi:hypothetical protein
MAGLPLAHRNSRQPACRLSNFCRSNRLPHRFGHRLRLIVAAADENDKRLAMLGFTYTVVRESSVNTIYSASRILFKSR